MTRRVPIAERLARQVSVGGPDDCWPWSGSVDGGGYGTISNRLGRGHAPEKTHRVAWEIANGTVPDGHVLHTCDNPPCCNPAHLFIGTPFDNADDRERKGRGGDRRVYGERHGMAKLSIRDVLSIIKEVECDSMGSVARKYSVSRKTIYNILRGKVWSHVTGVKNGVI